MGLSDDQKALLRLLAKREEGYEDIAALKAMSVDEVRAEVQEALDALQRVGEEAPPPPPPPPVEEAPAAEPQKPPAEPPPAEEPEAAKPVAPPPVAASGSKQPARTAVAGPLSALPPERRRLLLVTGGALGIVAVVLIAIAVLGGDDSSSPASSGSGGVNAENAAAENGKITQAVLTPPDGGDASGRAIFGRLGKEEIVLQVTANGLEPSKKGEPYMVWLYRSPKLSLRVGSTSVGESGRLGARFSIPAELLAYVASGAFKQIHLSRTSNAAYQRAVSNAKQNNAIPRYTGETVLTGEITGPITKTQAEEPG